MDDCPKNLDVLFVPGGSFEVVHDADVLRFLATPVEARVVTDRNRVSGGGVTAGLDFGLVIPAQLLGEDIAKMTQLALEYDPDPPFDAGPPRKAGLTIMKMMQEWLGAAQATLGPMCIAASKKMGDYSDGGQGRDQ